MYRVIVKIGFFTLIVQNFGLARRNNVCTKLFDYPFRDFSSNCFYNPDQGAKTPVMIIRHGYPLEVHKVVTSDGYILTVYRIPSKMINGKAVYLQHGYMASSEHWVNIRNRSLAFRLHDLGYDVWLGNIRGTVYSSGHIALKSSENNFWNFSLDTLAQYDIRDTMKYMVRNTKMPVIYVGHSMGNTLVFMYASEFPIEAQQLLRGIIALAPVIYAGPNVFERIYSLVNGIYTNILERLHIYSYLTKSHPIQVIVRQFCYVFPFVCREALNIVVGKTNQLKPEDLFLVLGVFPARTSTRVVEQLAHIFNRGEFSKCDYTKRKNLEMYGTKKPPNYNLGNIKTPAFLYYGLNDGFVDTKSVTRGFREIGSRRKQLTVIPKNTEEKFNHLDFIYGKDTEEYLYKYLFKDMETF